MQSYLDNADVMCSIYWDTIVIPVIQRALELPCKPYKNLIAPSLYYLINPLWRPGIPAYNEPRLRVWKWYGLTTEAVRKLMNNFKVDGLTRALTRQLYIPHFFVFPLVWFILLAFICFPIVLLSNGEFPISLFEGPPGVRSAPCGKSYRKIRICEEGGYRSREGWLPPVPTAFRSRCV